jgi:hypothetical protein
MKLGIPFEHSIHNLLLRYYLAEHGLNPDTDVQLKVVPPPKMVAELKEGNIDGFLGRSPSTSVPCSTAWASSWAMCSPASWEWSTSTASADIPSLPCRA